MDYFLNDINVYNRLKEEYKKYTKLIIAYDFDHTIYDYNKLGREYNNVISLLQRWKNHAYFVLYTASKEDRFKEIKHYLDEKQIPCDSINKNILNIDIPQGGKLYYNILLDDRAGLKECYDVLLKLINEIERGLI